MSGPDGACIVGAAMTELSTDSGRAAERLAIEVATAACADAAIDPAAIDGDRAGPTRPT